METDQLVRALREPACYPHPVTEVEVHATHISWVFLAGDYAYKVKKPVSLGFLDFSTLDARRHFCEEELRLNRRFAPDLYLDVVEIRGSLDAPRISGSGPVVEYALKMRRFEQDALATRLLAHNALTATLITDLAGQLASFHSRLAPASGDSSYGTAESVLRTAIRNFEEILPLVGEDNSGLDLAELQDWTEREFSKRFCAMRDRHEIGMVRECHGDLHLRNIVLLDGALVPFDCIEFSAELRWNDVMSEVAFLTMDLMDHGARELAWVFLNAYLETTGDYSGLAVLPFYLVYRAMVGAKIHLLRATESGIPSEERARLRAAFRGYLDLARGWTVAGNPAIVLMHGLSGSGKSSLAAALIPILGAIRIRSDIERKRIRGVAPLVRSESDLESGLYAPNETRATYAHLAATARMIVASGYTAIVDAAFLKRSQRAELVEAASSLNRPVLAVEAHAPLGVLRQRIASRTGDASEATQEVLTRQLETVEPIVPSEGLLKISADTAHMVAARAALAVAAQIHCARSAVCR